MSKQLAQVVVPPQVLGGKADEFSFMAYPVPRLTYDQRKSMELVDRDHISLRLSQSEVRIDLDDFGKINWFYVSRWPEMYSELQRRLAPLS